MECQVIIEIPYKGNEYLLAYSNIYSVKIPRSCSLLTAMECQVIIEIPYKGNEYLNIQQLYV